MADGLLLTRRERVRAFWLKFVYGLGPSVVLVAVALVLSGGAVAWTIAFFGVLFGLMVATTAKKPRGALIGGVSVAVFILLVQIAVAWLVTHPVVR
jgi:hypothetical protein